MSLRKALLVEFERVFPGQFSRGPGDEHLVATFAAAHPLVGDVKVWDDDTEAMIGVGAITHLHIDETDTRASAERTSTAPELHEKIAQEVAAWLQDLFSDKILLWCSPTSHGTGGHQRFPEDAEWSLMGPEDETFRWSGPVSNPLA